MVWFLVSTEVHTLWPSPSLPSPGTGKTLTVNAKLFGGMPPEVLPLRMTFSARTSANMLQDIIGVWDPFQL